MNKRLVNAIRINFKNLFFSVSIKLLLIFVTFCSLLFSFWPSIYTFVTEKEFQAFDLIGNILVIDGISYVIAMFTVFLITRIGAQVGFSKGSMVTETILTSISRTQLYLSYVISSVFVAAVSLVIVMLPAVAAALIQNSKYVLFCGTLDGRTVLFLYLHIVLSVFVLVNMVVSMASMVQRAEDTGPLILFCLLPTLLSMIYVSFKSDMFHGALYVLNLIPLTSWVPAIAVGVSGRLDIYLGMVYIVSDLIFAAVSFAVGNRIFQKNITVK